MAMQATNLWSVLGVMGAVWVVVGTLAMALTELPDEPVEIGHETQFLVDDYLVDNRWALRISKEAMVRAVHQPVKHEGNPVIPGRGGYANVAWDEEAKLYRLIYQDFWLQSPKPNLKFTYAIAYAESTDGLEWTLPNIGTYEWRGSKENNIVLRGPKNVTCASPCLLDLPEEHRRGHKFVLLYKTTDGIHLIGSKDCIHWEPESDVRIGHRFWPDTQSCIVWDPKRKEFVWFTRATRRYHPTRGRLEGGAIRRVARLANKELWTEWPIHTQNIIIPDAVDAADRFNYIYGMPTRVHGGVYWGFSWPFKMNTDIYTELMISRNGRVFEHLPGRPRLIDLGPEGSWDAGMVFGSPRWIEVGDTWRIYYCGHDGPHGSHDRTPGIGVATIRKEGFVSLRGPKRGGVVCTRAIRWPGGRLFVNCDASKGELRVRISAGDKREGVPGFSYDDCHTFTGDSTSHEVTWKEKTIDSLKDEVIFLEFFLKEADLYTFRAGEAAKP